MRTNQFNAAPPEPLTKWIGIGRAIVNQPCGIFPRSSTASSGNRHLLQGRLDQCDFVRRGRGQLNSQRKTLAIAHHQALRTLSAFGFTDLGTPFFAGENVPSPKVSSQSRRCCSSNFPRKVRHSFSHTPCSSQSRKRRQQVAGEGYSRGRSFHRAPLRSTHKMPSKQRRSEMRFRPRDRDRFGRGNNGSIILHCSSVSSDFPRWVIEATPFDDLFTLTPVRAQV